MAAVREASSKRDLDSAIGVIRNLYGFAHVVFLSVKVSAFERPHMAYCTTYPDEWTLRYLQKDYFRIDPVVAIYRTGFHPVDWSSLDQSSENARELFREAGAMGIGSNGITVPVRGPSGERSLFSATSDASEQDWRHLCEATKHDLMLLSHYMHERFLAVTGTRARRYRELSRRERECLELLAKGLVPKRIAVNLQLSESAVRLYLASARRKLNAATIYQAIARASFLELIDV